MPGCDEWTTVLAVRARRFVSVQFAQHEALRAMLVAARVPDLVAQSLGHKVPRAHHLTTTDWTRIATQMRSTLCAQAVSVEALQDGRPQQHVAHRTLQHVLDTFSELCNAARCHSTTTRPLVLPAYQIGRSLFTNTLHITWRNSNSWVSNQWRGLCEEACSFKHDTAIFLEGGGLFYFEVSSPRLGLEPDAENATLIFRHRDFVPRFLETLHKSQKQKKKSVANSTDRATAACQRS
jgi:hypothetical protein